jgi:adenylate cyclase
MAPLVARVRTFLVPEPGALRAAPFAAVAGVGMVLGALLALSQPGQRAEWVLYDRFMRGAAADAAPAPGIVVVAIDEPSFAEIGLRWPWPRSLHAALIDQLVEGGARSIALDILFDVPAARPEDDDALADAVRRAGTVVLASDQAVVADRRYEVRQWTDPIPALASAAAATGVIRIPYDADYVLRRAWLWIEGRPSLALAVATREPGFTPPETSDAPRLFRFNGLPRQGVLTVSYYQALDRLGLLPEDIFRNKHVLVGRSLAATTIDEQTDHYTTPVAARMAGVEVHATIVDALLRQRLIRDPVGDPGLLGVLLMLSGAAIALVVYRLGPALSLVAVLGGATMIVGIGYLLLAQGVRVPAAGPAIVLVSVYGVTTAYRFALVVRERRMLKRAFQHYVSPAIIERLLADPSRLRLGGDEYDVTVLFSDLEGFTTLSEHLAPAELSAHLGQYFKEMLDVALPQHGTLDKLIGDAIMMYFGCPIPDARHAEQACRAALAMQQRMVDLNARWTTRGLPSLRMRIGLNSGPAVAGNMGTDTIFNYTVIGDSVNLASRLEGANREYGTQIIIGEDTWMRVRQVFVTRELDWIRVKGKTRPVAVYELIGEAGVLHHPLHDLFARYSEGLACYREGRWAAACAAFEDALAVDPADGPSRIMIARCREYVERAPDRWDGVHVMSSK